MDEAFIQERIARLRMRKGVSARDMSLTLGQSESYINTIENKKSLPSMTVFLYICEYFGIGPSEFFDDANDDPAELRELIENLKQMDERPRAHIAGLARALVDRRSSRAT